MTAVSLAIETLLRTVVVSRPAPSEPGRVAEGKQSASHELSCVSRTSSGGDQKRGQRMVDPACCQV